MEISGMKKEKIRKDYHKLLAYQAEHPDWSNNPLKRSKVSKMKRALRSYFREIRDAADVTCQYITDTVTLYSLPDYIETYVDAEFYLIKYFKSYQEIKLQKRGNRWMAFCIRGE